MPLKNNTSVARNTQMPSVAASACCGIVANCGSGRGTESAGSGIHRAVLRDRDAGIRVVFVGASRYGRGVRKIMLGRWRLRLPFEPGCLPWVGRGARSAEERPGQVEQRHQVGE